LRKRRAGGQLEYPPFGRQVGFARAVTGLAWTSLEALAVGASAAGAVAIGALAIRALAVRNARIKHLNKEELEVGRLYVRELVVEQEQAPQSRTRQLPKSTNASTKYFRPTSIAIGGSSKPAKVSAMGELLVWQKLLRRLVTECIISPIRRRRRRFGGARVNSKLRA
jgi:hypothetical protein